MKDLNIHLISASAGSGKTYELMEQLYAEISAKNIDPDSIMAVTFTNKAANELVTRVQQKLVSEGEVVLSHQMGAAKIGTVHSVFGKLLKTFSYELGLSPELEIIDELQAKSLFSQAFVNAPTVSQFERLRSLIDSMGLDYDKINTDIELLCNQARQNSISGDDFDKLIDASKEQLNAILDRDHSSEPARELVQLIADYKDRYSEAPDDTQKTIGVHDTLQKIASRCSVGRLAWSDWIKISGLSPAKKSIDIYTPIISCADRLSACSEFRAEYEELIELSFKIAEKALVDYQELKKNLGVMDFGDQERMALEILSDESQLKRLEGEVDLFLVDEFQDSNPIQLAIFLKIAQIAKKSIWVGDPKQSIFGFQGADPELMLSVLSAIQGSTSAKILDANYRSTKELVDFNSELFSRAFRKDGIDEQNVRLEPKATLNTLSDPLTVWSQTDKNAENRMAALAREIQNLLNSDAQIFDKATNAHRVIRPADIAILMRTNASAQSLAKELEALDVKVSVADDDIMLHPEICACIAALRLAVYPDDTLAQAELMIFFGADPLKIVSDSLQKEKVLPLFDAIESLKNLDVTDRTPYEMLAKVISISGIEDYLAKFSSSKEQLQNVNSLLFLCKRYEEQTANAQQPCSVVGFLSELESLIKRKDGRDARDGGDVVTVTTYHRSKGLEWPVVILCDLEKQNRPADQFGVRIVNQKEFNPADPLKDRALLYLPWVFGENNYGIRSKVDWVNRKISLSSDSSQIKQQDQAEQRRLLYVGMTRARELIIFVRNLSARGDIKNQFLGALSDESGEVLLQFPSSEGEPLKIGSKEFQCAYREVELDLEGADSPAVQVVNKDVLWPQPMASDFSPAPFAISPSAATLDAEQIKHWSVGEIVDVPVKLCFSSELDPQKVGDLLHVFYASMFSFLDPQELHKNATLLLRDWKFSEEIDTDELCASASSIREVLQTRWANSKIGTEVHAKAILGETRYEGEIDLLLETDDELVVIDHKSGICKGDDFLENGKQYISQLDSYRKMLAAIYPDKRISTWINWLRAGKMVEYVCEVKH